MDKEQESGLFVSQRESRKLLLVSLLALLAAPMLGSQFYSAKCSESFDF
jgi:hypothetical protein